jgi:hypothetical protein
MPKQTQFHTKQRQKGQEKEKGKVILWQFVNLNTQGHYQKMWLFIPKEAQAEST